MIISLLKLYWVHILALISTSLSIYLLTRPTLPAVTLTKIEFVDRVVTKEVVKYIDRDVVKYKDRVITRTVTKPGGIKVVEKIKETGGQSSKTQTVETVKERDTSKTVVTTAIRPIHSKYMLGFNGNHYLNHYSISVGIRVHNSIPVYVGGGIIKTNGEYKPFLSLGVVF